MTEDEVAELVTQCPLLFHMAEGGSWTSIQRHGLLSTSALLDLVGVKGAERYEIESKRRPESVVLENTRFGRFVIRDNKPMDDRGLARALNKTMTPREWYELLNGRVFFWLTRERLGRLLTAPSYIDQEHDVLELDTAAIIDTYNDAIELAPINSGATKPMAHPRGRSTFRPISDYPYAEWRKKRRRGERVVELTVAHSIADIKPYVRRVVRMKGEQEISTLFAK